MMLQWICLLFSHLIFTWCKVVAFFRFGSRLLWFWDDYFLVLLFDAENENNIWPADVCFKSWETRSKNESSPRFFETRQCRYNKVSCVSICLQWSELCLILSFLSCLDWLREWKTKVGILWCFIHIDIKYEIFED